MNTIEQNNEKDHLSLVIDGLRNNNVVTELRRRLHEEEAAVEAAVQAFVRVTTGTVDQEIELPENASKKLLDMLKPLNIPGLSIAEEWKIITNRGSYYNDSAESGKKFLKVVYKGSTSYLLVTFNANVTESVTISKDFKSEPQPA